MKRHNYKLLLSFETGKFELVCAECGKTFWMETDIEAVGDCGGHPPDLGISVSESILVKDKPK